MSPAVFSCTWLPNWSTLTLSPPPPLQTANINANGEQKSSHSRTKRHAPHCPDWSRNHCYSATLWDGNLDFQKCWETTTHASLTMHLTRYSILQNTHTEKNPQFLIEFTGCSMRSRCVTSFRRLKQQDVPSGYVIWKCAKILVSFPYVFLFYICKGTFSRQVFSNWIFETVLHFKMKTGGGGGTVSEILWMFQSVGHSGLGARKNTLIVQPWEFLDFF